MAPLRRKIIVTVEGARDVKGLRDETGKLINQKGGLERMGNGFKEVGQKAARWIKGVAVGAFIALGAALIKGTRDAAGFRNGMAQVATLMGTSTAATRTYEKAVIDMAGRTGVPLNQLTDALYQVVSAGYSGSEALNVLEQAAYSAVGGGTDLRTAVDGVTTSLQAWGRQAEDSADVTDSYFTAVRRGKTTFDQIAGSIGRVAPLAESTGVALDEILAATAALTLGGFDTAASMTSLRGVLSKILGPTEAAKKLAAELGIEFNAAALESKGLKGFLDEVAVAVQGDSEKMKVLFEDVEALNGVLALTGAQADNFASILDDMEVKTGATSDAFKTMSAETTTLSQRVKNNLNAALLDLGTRVLPTVNRGLATLLNHMESMKSPQEQMLNFLRESGADREVIIEWEVRVQQDQAKQAIEELEAQLDQLSVRDETSRFDLLSGFSGEGFLTGGQRLIDLGVDELQEGLKNAKSDLEEYLETASRGGAEAARLSANEGKRLRGNVDALEEALRIQESIAAVQSTSAEDMRAAAAERLDQEQALQELINTPPGDTPLTDEQRQQAEKLAEVFRALVEAQRLAAASTDDVRAALSQLFQKQQELRALNAQAAALEQQFGEQGAVIVAERRAQIEKEIESLQGRVAREEELKAAIDRTAASLNEYIDNVDLAGLFGDGEVRAEMLLRRLGQVNDAAKTYAETLTEISVEERSGALSAEDAADRRTRASNEYEAALTAIYEELKRLGLDSPAMLEALEEAWGKVKDETEEADDKAKRYADTLRSVASGARGVLRLADAFGELDERTREALESVVDLADGIAGVIANPADIGSWVQSLGGLVGGLNSLFGVESDEARRAREELQQEIRENAAALHTLTEAIREQTQIGSQYTQAQLDTAAGLLEQIRNWAAAAGDPGAFGYEAGPAWDQWVETHIRRRWEQLLDTGIEGVEDFYEQYRLLLESGMSPVEAVQQVIEGMGGLGEHLAELIDLFNEYAQTIEGQIESIRDAQQFLGLDGQEAVNQFIEGLLENVGDLTPEMEALLAEMLDLDLSTDAGQAAFDELIAQMYRLGAASGLSVDELEALLTALQNLAGGVESAVLDIDEATSIAEVIEALRRALRFGAVSVEEAMVLFLARLRELTAGEGRSLLAPFLAQIEGLDLNTQAGQEALDAIIAAMFDLGADAFGMTQEAFDAMLAQLQALGGLFGQVGAEGQAAGGAIREAIRQIERAIRFGGMGIEEAFAAFIAAIRDLDLGGSVLSGTGGPLIDAFLDQIAGLDLNTQAGQDALDALIAEMFALGPGAFGMTEAEFDAFLAQLQGLAGQFGIALDPDPIQQAIRDLERALRFGAITTEEALASFLQTLRDLDFGDVLGDAEGNTILDAFLDQIEGLDLGTEAGQQALQDIVAQMFDLGAGAFGLTEEAFDALLAQLLALGNAFETAAEALDPDPVRDAIDYIRLALRFGAIELEDALAMLLAAIRDAATGPMLGDAEGNTVLDQFLDQIAGLDLGSEEGQEALAEIIRQMFLLGAGAFGLEEDVFLAMLAELQNLGGQFGTAADPSGSNAFRVARTITEWQANRLVDLGTAQLYTLRDIAAVLRLLAGLPTAPPPPNPPDPQGDQPGTQTPPIIVPPAERPVPMPSAFMPSVSHLSPGASSVGGVGQAARSRPPVATGAPSDPDWVGPFYVHRDNYTDIVRRIGKDLRRSYGNQ